MSVKNFRELFRQNTGTHFLDSGGDSGRHWQQGPITGKHAACFDPDSVGSDHLGVTIETAIMLEESFKIDSALIEKAEEEGFETVEEFLESVGYEEISRDNPYNYDNDLSQVYVIAVMRHQEANKHKDWLYAKDETNDLGLRDVVVLISAHNGADVRGGYSDSVPIISSGDYAVPVDVVAGFMVDKAWNEEGTPMDPDELSVDASRWEIGYSRSPSHTFSQDIEKVVSVSEDGQTAVVLLKSGEKVQVHPDVRCA